MIKQPLFLLVRLLLLSCVINQSALAQNVNVSGATVGNGLYPDLGSAFTAINSGSQTGSTIIISILGNTTETATAVLNQGTWTQLSIVPSGGVSRTISGSVAGQLIDFNGADRVLLDGLNSGGNSLTINNTLNAATSTIRFINDAHVIAIRNATVLGANTSITSGTIFLSTGTTTGNDTITINTCTVAESGANFPVNAIYSSGTATAGQENSSIIISNNNISNFFSATSLTTGTLVSTGNTDWTIQNNRYFQTASRTYTAANVHRIIQITSGNNHQILGNTIGYSSSGATGTYTMTSSVATRLISIDLSVGTTTATSVQGNTISSISLSSSSGAATTNGVMCGINVTAGSVNIGTITPNTIGSSSAAGSLVVTSTTTQAAVVGINSSSTGTVVIQNNLMGGFTSSGITATIAGSVFGINVSGAATSMTISGNTIGNTVADNMRAGTSGLTTGNSLAAGINITSGPTALTVSNNTIQNLSSYGSGATGYVRGIAQVTGGTGAVFSGNSIHDLKSNNTTAGYSTGVIAASGIYIPSGTNTLVNGNTIYNLSLLNTGTGNYAVAGISLAAANNTTTSNNTIYGISNAGTGTLATAPPVVSGILIRSGASTGTLVTVNNNMISLGNSQSSNTAFIGIFANHGSTPDPIDRIYHNTVNIEGTAASGALPSMCFNRGDLTTTTRTVTVDVRNNLFVNNRTGGTGQHFAISNNYGATVSATGWGANASNYNILNAATGTVGYWGAAQTLAAWNTASASDGGSYTGATVTFVNNANDLHLNFGTTPNLIESEGQLIAGFTTDIDGQLRPGPSGSVNGGALFPDVGADEIDGVILDLLAPAITYSPLSYTCSTGDRTLTATITDISGVPSTGSLVPRVYYKKNTGSYFSSPGVLTAGTVQNGTWTFNIIASDMGGLVVGDAVSYFVIAQDIASTMHLSSSPSTGLVATDVNTVTTPPTTPTSYTINSILNGIYTVGVSGTYPTLTAAVAAYNNSCLAGPVVFSLIDPTYASETFPITINANTNASSTNTLTIQPASGNTVSISGSSATGIIILNGADFVTVNGCNTTTVNSLCPLVSASRNLTITNTNTSTASGVVWLSTTAGLDAVTNCSIQNCIIIGNAPSTTIVGLGVGGTTIGNGGTLNNNISFINNDIRACQFAIYAVGASATSKNQNLTINQNFINTASPNNISQTGIYTAFTNNINISGNTIGNILNTATSQDPVAINAGFGAVNGFASTTTGIADGVSNVTITNNIIGTVQQTVTYSAAGIGLGNTISGTSLIANNMIYGVASNSTSGDFASGIVLGGGTAQVNVYHNTVSMQGTIPGVTAATQTSACLAVTSATVAPLDIRNNIFTNTQIGNTSATVRFTAIALGYSSTLGNYTSLVSNYNDLITAGAGPGTYQIGISGGVTGGTSRTSLANWQTETGRDINSSNVPATFVSATNLHAVAGSNTGIQDAGTNISAITTDIDCETRNCLPDIGADEFGIPPGNEINVTGNSIAIVDGDITPSLADHTDFGSQITCTGSIARTFTIQNTGIANLTVSTISLTGSNASDFTLGGITLPATIAPSGTTTFTVTFDPSSTGNRTATITITNDDCDEGLYDFAIQGTGLADVTPPVTPTLADVTAQCSITPTAPTTTDNCAGTITGTTATLFPITAQGTTVVTWTFNDGNGNSTTAVQNVIIQDLTPPVTPTLADVTAQCSATPTAPTTTDNCAGTITGTTATLFPITAQGTTVVTWTFNDGNGNSTTAAQNVIIQDVTPPATPTLATITAQCSATPTAPTTTDNCAGTITGTTATPFPIIAQGTTVVTWIFNDGNGNSTTAVQNVIIQDVTPPATPTLTTLTGQCSITPTAPTTTDNCAGTITGTTATPFPINTQGTTVVTWTFNDGNGNSTTAAQNVIIQDVTPPATPTLATITAQCSITPTAPTTTDNCAGTITGTTATPFPITVQGTTVVTWIFNDGNGNSTTAAQNVIIQDVTPPATPTLADVTAQCSITPTAPTTTDNCAGTITGTTATPFPITTQGTTVVTWTFNDGNGNTTTAPQNVIIQDVTPPATPTLATVTGQCSASVTAPTTADNCAGTITGTTTDPLTYSTQGTFTVNWTFNDGNGNSITVPQTVIVDNTSSPTPPTLSTITGQCSATVAVPTTFDNCIGTITGTTSDPLIYSTQGTYTVNWTFNYSNGSIIVPQTVIVDDVTNPTTPTLATVTGQCSATVTVPTTTDNCAGTITGTTTDPLTYSTQGTFTVNWTFNDGNGNSIIVPQTVIVDDVTNPATPTLATVTGQCSATVTAPTTTDNCAGTITGTTANPLTYSTQGTFTVNWTFNDGNGNSITVPQTVIVDDVTNPATPTLATVTGQCSATVTAPTTTDNCAGTITGTTANPLTYSTQGTFTVNWTFNDGNGNSITVPQTVIVDDVTNPATPTLATVTGQCSATVTAPTTTDNCAGTITGTTANPLTYSTQGTFTVNWTFNDGNGNSITVPQTVIVDDITNPATPTLATVTGQCSATVTAPTTTDNCAGTITGTTANPLTYSTQGTFTVNWTFNDGNGNSITVPQTVIVDDITNPATPTLATVTGQCSATVTAPTTTDNCAGTITGTTTDPLTYSTQGTFTVNWTFNDGNGNSITVPQTVIVDDITNPATPTLATVTGQCSATVTAPTTTDNCAGTITGTTANPLTYSTQGTFTVNWTFNDGNGNSITVPQTVIVDDITNPATPTLATVTGQCSATVTAPTTTDNCAGTITGTTANPLTYSTQGTFTVNWTFNDGNGNSITVPQTVIVDDITNPATPTLATVTGQCSATVTAPTTTDNCAGTITGTTTDPLTYSTQGTFTVNWTFNDGNGNSITVPQTVIVDDITNPATPTLATVTGQCSATVTVPTTTDNCAGTITGTTTDPLTYSTQGTFTVNWTFNDGNGNSITVPQTVIVDDVTNPATPTLATVTGQCSATVTAPTTTDNCAGTITGTTTDPLTYSTQGTFTVNWTFNDGNGNSITVPQTVIVDDITNPATPTLATVTGQCSATVTVPTTADNCAGTITGTTTDPLTYSTQGTFTVNWTFNDGNGNSITVPQTVIVDDITNPATPTLATVTGQCSATVTVPTTTDNCAGTITGTTTDPLTYSTQGTFTVNWTFNDGNGNSITVPQTVIVDDVTNPIPDNAVLTDITATCELTSLTAPTATDNCAATVIVTNDAILPITQVGTTVVTWMYDDGNGNIAMQTQNVIISPIVATTSVNGITITASNGTSYQWINCSTNQPISGETNQTFTATANGSYAVVVTNNNCSDTSNCVTINTIGLDENTSAQILVYPNPTNGIVTVNLGDSFTNRHYTILSVDGKKILEGTANDSLFTIDLQEQSRGVYFIHLGDQQIFEIVKN